MRKWSLRPSTILQDSERSSNADLNRASFRSLYLDFNMLLNRASSYITALSNASQVLEVLFFITLVNNYFVLAHEKNLI